MSVLAVDGLAKSFGGVRAVDGVSFAIDAGELVALIGPNGAGKSTLFNAINGQLAPDADRVMLAGRSIGALATAAIWRCGVGRTFQVAASFGSMTVAENVQMALASHHRRLGALWPVADRLYRDEAIALLALVDMADAAGRAAAVLAYGDLKRLELAVALAADPVLLRMDEPTAGMAPGERAAMMAVVARIAGERALAVLFTEHDMDVVFGHATRIIVLDHGRLIADGLPDAVRNDAGVRAVYLGDAGEAPS